MYHIHFEVYNRISTELASKGYVRNAAQNKNKINQSIKLKKGYKECNDHNSKSGNDRKVIDYYDDLDAILGKRCRMRLRMTHLLKTILCPILILALTKHHRRRLQSEEEEVVERCGRGLGPRL